MKCSLVFSAAVVATVVFWFRHESSSPAAVSASEPADIKPGWTAAANTDAAAVFQRAFWRKPGTDDRILHAERVEWNDPNGVAKWQWFLVVEPGQDLQKWLREQNPFSLEKAAGYAAEEDSKNTRRPAWFPARVGGGDCEIHHAGNMTLIFSRTENRLYATDSGYGLTPGVAAR